MSKPFKLLPHLLACLFFICLISCKEKKSEQEYTPWGTPLEHPSDETTPPADSTISLSDIIAQGELIMLQRVHREP